MAKSIINQLIDVADLEMLLNPSSIAGAEGGSVSTITNGYGAASIATNAVKPTIHRAVRPSSTDELRMVGTSNQHMSVTGVTWPGTGFTLMMVVRVDRASPTASHNIFGGASNNPNIYFRLGVNRLTCFDNGAPREFGPGGTGNPTSWSGAGGAFQGLNQYNIVFIRRSGTNWIGDVNGERHTLTTASSIPDITTLHIGGPVAILYGGIALAAGWDRVLTDGEVDTLSTALRAHFIWEPIPKGKPAILGAGDSIIHGDYCTATTFNANRLLRKGMDDATAIPAAYRRLTEFAIPSAQFTGLQTTFTGGYNVLLPSDALRPFVFVFAGTNDTALGGVSGLNTELRLDDFAVAIKARNPNAKVVALTMLPRSPGTWEAARTAFNTDVLTNTTNLTGRLYSKDSGANYDYVLDIAANTNIGEAGDYSNTTYYHTDGIHPNNGGHAEIAADVKVALEYLYALSSGEPEVTAVSVADANCQAGDTVTLAATVTVTGGASQAVTWTVFSGNGSINPTTGVFDSAGMVAGNTSVVRARSVYDPYWFDDATVTIVADVAPTITGAATNAAGTQTTVTPSEDVLYPSPLPAHWSLTADGSPVAISAVELTNGEIILTHTQVYDTDTLLLAYLGGANVIEDTTGNDLAAVSNIAVTNNSTEPEPVASTRDPLGIERLGGLVTGGGNILSRLPRG